MKEADKQTKQLRIDYQLAREIEIAAAIEGISIKDMMGRVWRERKNFEFSFFSRQNQVRIRIL